MNLTKKVICILISGATLGAAAPAFADRGHESDRADRGRGWDHRGHERVVEVERYRHYAPPRPVYYQAPPVYYSQPAPVYSDPYAYGQPVYAPAPVYGDPLGAAVGAIAGALIGNQIGGRGASAAGAMIGGAIGSRM